jgi:hypothetical protein
VDRPDGYGLSERSNPNSCRSFRLSTRSLTSPGLPSSPSRLGRSPSYQGGFFAPKTPDFTPHKAEARRRGSWAGVLGLTNVANQPRLRLIRRDAPFHQSSGRVYMHRRGHGPLERLAVQDPFHVALSLPVYALILMCASSYTLVMLLFAGIYMGVDHPGVGCGIAPAGEYPSFYHAFAFSLETLTTIGYGIPNEGNFFEEGCASLLVAVYFEAMIFILLNASIVGVLFARVSVADRKASQIIFSNKATIRCVRNRFYFMFQARATPRPRRPAHPSWHAPMRRTFTLVPRTRRLSACRRWARAHALMVRMGV